MTTARPTPNDPWRFVWVIAFGLFLGFAILKFGNPVVLDQQIVVPTSLSETLTQPWPLRWSYWGFGALALMGWPFAWKSPAAKIHRLARGLWMPLVLWLAWQGVAATQTVDGTLTRLTLPHFIGIVVAYGFGLALLAEPRAVSWMLAGLLAGFCFCLMRANTQRLVEFPADRATLLEGERTGWTNFPPDALAIMRRDAMIIHTNGVDIANPLILSKLERGRVHGTLVYPNALAGAVLLLLPVALYLLESITRAQRPVIRWAALGLLGGLGLTALGWSGSKSGWLIALAMGVVLIFRVRRPGRLQWVALALIVGLGLLAFAVRFQSYFAAGATSVGARFDYWKAAVQTTWTYPLVGTGPGTFQRPYARLKSADSEMARLTHNDYLEQFSDSGVVGGLAYLGWAVSWLLIAGRWVWHQPLSLWFFTFLGVAAWLAQGLSEFSLYVPALAWSAFALAGALAGATARETNPSATPSRFAPVRT